MKAMRLSTEVKAVVDNRIQQENRRWLESESLLLDYPFLAASCFHTPNASVIGVTKLLEARRIHKVSNFLSIGDWFDQGCFSPFLKQGPEHKTEEEVQEAGKLINLFKEQGFKQQTFVTGNHDIRIMKQCKTGFDMKLLFKMAGVGSLLEDGSIRVSNKSYCETVDRRWIMGHPDGYSKQAGKMPQDISIVKDKSVICGHNHVIGYRRSPNGKFSCIDCGCMTDSSSTIYKNTKMNSSPEWNIGFVIVFGPKKFILYDEDGEVILNFTN